MDRHEIEDQAMAAQSFAATICDQDAELARLRAELAAERERREQAVLACNEACDQRDALAAALEPFAKLAGQGYCGSINSTAFDAARAAIEAATIEVDK